MKTYENNFQNYENELNKKYKKTTVYSKIITIKKYVICPPYSQENIEYIYNKIMSEENISLAHRKKVKRDVLGYIKFALEQLNYDLDISIFEIDLKNEVDELKERNIYTENDFKRFIKGATILETAIFTTLFYTGVRIGELRAITWEDINFDESYIKINKQAISKVKGLGTYIAPPKSRSSNRYIIIPNIVINTLKKLKLSVENKYKIKPNYYVFGNKDTIIYENKIRLMQRKLENKNKIKHITIHEFRHSYITMMYKKGLNPKVLQSQVGHSSIATTLDIYTNLSREYNKNVIKSLLD